MASLLGCPCGHPRCRLAVGGTRLSLPILCNLVDVSSSGKPALIAHPPSSWGQAQHMLS